MHWRVFRASGRMARMVGNAPYAILQRLFHCDEELTPEVASYFLGVSLSEADHERIGVLSEKANEGELSPDERDELALYVLLIDFLSIIHSRARTTLSAKSPAA